MLELYHHGSSACAAKVRFALEEKQLTWKGHYVDILKGEQFEEAFLALNPKAVVPVLIHGGKIIPESTVICEYLEDCFPEHPLYSQDPYQRAQIRLWTKAVDEELHPACSALTYVVSHRHSILRQGVGSFEDFLQAGSGEGRAARRLKWQWIQEGIEAPGAMEKILCYDSYLHKMEEALGEHDYLAGDSFSMADVAMTPYVNRVAALAMEGLWEKGRLPRLEQWWLKARERPAFKPAFLDWMPDSLAREMLENGRQSWPQIKAKLGIGS